jgi:hypothetical protein
MLEKIQNKINQLETGKKLILAFSLQTNQQTAF